MCLLRRNLSHCLKYLSVRHGLTARSACMNDLRRPYMQSVISGLKSIVCKSIAMHSAIYFTSHIG
jgi:hypothetical protein